MLAALDTWRVAGSSRLDVNLDGKADAGPGPAIWDALYPRLADAILAPATRPAERRAEQPGRPRQRPGHRASRTAASGSSTRT